MPGTHEDMTAAGKLPPLDASNALALERRIEQAGRGVTRSQQERLFALEQEGKLDLLTFLNDQVLREQEIFWLRFGSFAAVHAGALVLVTSEVVQAKWWLAAVGFALALAWSYVQWISLKYADRPKKLYHWYRRSLGIFWPYEYAPDQDVASISRWRRMVDAIQRVQLVSSTDIGILIPIGVAVLWFIVMRNNS